MNLNISLNALIPPNIPLSENDTWIFDIDLIQKLEQAIPQLESNAFLDLCNYGKSLVIPTWFMLVKEERLLNSLLKRQDIKFILNEFSSFDNGEQNFESKVYATFPRIIREKKNITPTFPLKGKKINMSYGYDIVSLPSLYDYDASILKKLISAGLHLSPQYPTVYLNPKLFLGLLEEKIFHNESDLLKNLKKVNDKITKNVLELFYFYNSEWKQNSNKLAEVYYIAEAFLLAEKNNYDTRLKIYEFETPNKKTIIHEGYYQDILKEHDFEIYNIIQNFILEQKLDNSLPQKMIKKQRKI